LEARTLRLVDTIAVIGAARQVTVAIVRCGVREDCASDDVTRSLINFGRRSNIFGNGFQHVCP